MTMYGNVEVSLFHTVRTLEETKELDDFLKDERLVIMKNIINIGMARTGYDPHTVINPLA